MKEIQSYSQTTHDTFSYLHVLSTYCCMQHSTVLGNMHAWLNVEELLFGGLRRTSKQLFEKRILDDKRQNIHRLACLPKCLPPVGLSSNSGIACAVLGKACMIERASDSTCLLCGCLERMNFCL